MKHRTGLSILGMALLASVAGGAPVAAQSRQVPAPKQSQAVVIHSATVHPVSGPPITDGFVIFRDGRIVDVGSGRPRSPRGTETIDARGLHVYPGLIGADTQLGLVETGAVSVTHDHNEHGGIKPEVRAAVAVNPDTDLIPVARANGILTAMVFPGGGLVSGRCSLIRLDGWTWEDMAIDPDAGLIVNWPRTEPTRAAWMRKSEAVQRKEIRERLDEIDRVFDDATAYARSRAHDPTVRTDLRFEAMRPVVTGTKPVYVRASSSGQIESAVAWGVRRGYRLVIVGGREADRVIPLLAEHDVPVIVPGLHRMPSARHGDYDEPFTLPKRLHEAGVRFCIASGSGSAHERNLNHNAATAAAYGLPRDVALRAVTSYPAQILGVGDRLGTLEAGKAATLIITTGDPLEITTDTLVAFIDGRRIDLGNRQKAMEAKYRQKYRQLGLIE
ncbi:MAG: amidohydrolase family protein [Planctomycetes bacterium]|nr:amidohydrolase family protein [Planctomycetota bacterium]